ncbi:MAG: hypothetical protein H3C57_10305, partial [Gammaproteobacteria bacterium]|nr:hypothetical protein [Gammaproteobacteria bacterium]
ALEALATVDDWGFTQQLEAEHESLGLYLSGHPFDPYRADAAGLSSGPLAALAGAPAPAPGTEYQSARDATIAGVVAGLRRRTGRIIVELDDGTGVIEMSVFPETYERCQELLVPGSLIIVTGQLRWDAYMDGWRLAAREMLDIERVIETRATQLLIRWTSERQPVPDARRLRQVLEPSRPGRCSIQVCYARADARARLDLGEEWAVRPSRELRERLLALVGMDGFRFVYGGGEPGR